MDTKLIESILNKIEENIETKKCIIPKEKFKKIDMKESNKSVVFVDGGQAELIKAVDFSLQFIRTAAIAFKNNEKVWNNVNEFFILVSAVEEKGNIDFKTEVFPKKGKAIKEFSINSMENSIKKGDERAEISIIGNIARRFSELEIAKDAIDKLDQGDIIVIDGNLKAMNKKEEDYLNSLFEKGSEKQVIISSLAKTSKIFIEKGSCLLSSLNEQGGDYPWYYDIKDSAVVKLNRSSKHVFEFNIYDKQKLKETVEVLAAYSKDAVFPGYPYGLILVDRIARVSNQEKGFLRTLFEAKAGKSWKRLKTALNAQNSHEMLDSIG